MINNLNIIIVIIKYIIEYKKNVFLKIICIIVVITSISCLIYFLLLCLVLITQYIIKNKTRSFVSFLWIPKLKSFLAGSFHILWSNTQGHKHWQHCIR